MKASLAKAKIMCRICKGDHWTTKCPFKDSHVPLSELENVISGTGPETSLTPEPSMPDASRGGPGKYVPPSMRNRGEGEGPAGDSMERRDRRDDYFTVRVSNLSEDANEDDLHAMFRKVGHIARVFCSRDKETGLCRGFAFVSYYNQADAEKAIAKLSGQGYDNLIMRVEMAQEWVLRAGKSKS